MKQRKAYKGLHLSPYITSSLTNSIFSSRHAHQHHVHPSPPCHFPPLLQHNRGSKPPRRPLRLFRHLLRPRPLRSTGLNLLTQHSNHHPIQHPSQHRNRPSSQRSAHDPHPLRRAIFGSCPCGFCVPVPCPDGHKLVEEAGV